MKVHDMNLFKNYMHITPDMFDELVEHLSPCIIGPGTNYRESLLAGFKVALTLRYLATGDSYKSMSYAYRVHHTTVSQLIPVVCQAIVDEFKQWIRVPVCVQACVIYYTSGSGGL